MATVNFNLNFSSLSWSQVLCTKLIKIGKSNKLNGSKDFNSKDELAMMALKLYIRVEKRLLHEA